MKEPDAGTTEHTASRAAKLKDAVKGLALFGVFMITVVGFGIAFSGDTLLGILVSFLVAIIGAIIANRYADGSYSIGVTALVMLATIVLLGWLAQQPSLNVQPISPLVLIGIAAVSILAGFIAFDSTIKTVPMKSACLTLALAASVIYFGLLTAYVTLFPA